MKKVIIISKSSAFYGEEGFLVQEGREVSEVLTLAGCTLFKNEELKEVK